MAYCGTFTRTTNAVGGEVWASTGDVWRTDYRGIVNSAVKKGDQVSIISGIHGKPGGMLGDADRFLIGEDVTAFGTMPGVTSTTSPKSKGTTIVATC